MKNLTSIVAISLDPRITAATASRTFPGLSPRMIKKYLALASAPQSSDPHSTGSYMRVRFADSHSARLFFHSIYGDDSRPRAGVTIPVYACLSICGRFITDNS